MCISLKGDTVVKISLKTWLLIGACIIYLVPITSDFYGITSWIAPLLLVLYMYKEKAAIAFAMASLLLSTVSIIANKDIIPDSLIVVSLTVTISTVLLISLLLLNRWVVQKSDHAVSVLFLPVMMTAIEYATSYDNVFGTFNSSAYSQLPFKPFAMLASIAGIWGIVFIQYLIISMLAYTFRSGFMKGYQMHKPLMIGALAVIVGAVIVGSMLSVGQESEKMVKVSGITPDRISWDEAVKTLIDQWGEPGFYTGLKSSLAFMEHIQRSNEGILTRTEEELKKGSRIISWSEGAAIVLENNEQAFTQRIQSLARAYESVVVAGYLQVSSGDGEKMENKLLIIDTNGEIAADYNKYSLVGGIEERVFVKGDAPIPVVQTALGKIAAAICFDADFPHRIRKAGLKNPDMLILPSSDWESITPYHTEISAFRSIENRTAVLRVTHAGMSAVYDANGRLLIEVNDFESENGSVITADIPLSWEKNTIYKTIGDLFPLLCGLITLIYLAGLLLKLLLARRNRT
jgi:apolipoprotein N-acyltransferase